MTIPKLHNRKPRFYRVRLAWYRFWIKRIISHASAYGYTSINVLTSNEFERLFASKSFENDGYHVCIFKYKYRIAWKGDAQE